MTNLSLPDEAKAVVWRIFGSGASPMKKRSTYDLIEPIIKERAANADPDWVINEIRGWFDSHGDRRWLKSQMEEPVAALILEGIGTGRGEIAIWAVGSMDAELAARLIRSCWSIGEIDSFAEAALLTLKKLCDADEVLDAASITRLDSTKARIPKSAVAAIMASSVSEVLLHGSGWKWNLPFPKL